MRYLFILAVLATLAPTTLQAQGPDVIAGDLLVMLKSNARAGTIANDLAELNGARIDLQVVREVSAPMRTWLLRFDPTMADQSVVLRAVRNHPDVLLAQNNHHVKLRNLPNDTNFGNQWHHQNIGSEAAWDISTGGLTAEGDTIVVCIIENANLPHADLIANAWVNHAEIPNNGIDDDGNGYVDDFRGWSPNDMDDDVYSGGHGTQVAGMIGATGNNELGVVGANWGVKMMVVSNSGASDEGVIASHTYPLVMRRRYNASNGAEGAFVVATNASWGINGGQPADAPLWCAMYDSLGTAGILNCGATSNSNVDVDAIGDLPTACPSDFMISVTATDVDDIRDFSAYGLTTIDVGAPGDNVYTTNISGGYGTTSGTSFASPLTAGVIGLLYSAPCASMIATAKDNPSVGALLIRQMLFEGVDQIPNLIGQTVTGGRINAGNSMQRIMDFCGSCPAPYGLAAMAVNVTSSVVSWGSVSGNSFDLRYRAIGTNDWTEVNGINAAELQLTDLVGCTTYQFQVRVLCDEELSDYSSSFTWTSEGCCTAPSTLEVVANSDSEITLQWSNVVADATFDVRYAPLGTSTWTVIPGNTSPTVTIAPLETCSSYTVEVRSQCDTLTSDWSNAFTIRTTGCGPCVDNAYCSSHADDAGSEWIRLVRIGAIDNASSGDDGYGDYTSVSTNLVEGHFHPFRLEPGYSGFNFSEWFRIWIDLDQDGAFDGEGEMVYDTDGRSNQPVVDSLSIPAGSPLGPTRMRVVMRYNLAPASACEANYDYGETEDYCVNIAANIISGVEDLGTGSHIEIYPQPADQDLTIHWNDASVTGTIQLVVFDATGRNVAQATLRNERTSLRTADLANGLYSYRLLTEGRSLGAGRFMVLHGR